MSTPAISVIVPTYNRVRVLEKSLACLAAQTVGPDALQVIVCDDGSTDDTVARVSGATWPFHDLVCVTQRNSGPAAARNRGLRHATAPLVMFINDDTLLSSDAVERHLQTHADLAGERLMVLGTFELMDDFANTRLGHLVDRSALLFQFCYLAAGDIADHNFAYTCNLSLDTEAARSVGFDESFTGPAGEDIDFGFELGKHGWGVYYQPEARSRHDHTMTVRSLLRTSRVRGRGLANYLRKHGANRWWAIRLRDAVDKVAELEATVATGTPPLERVLDNVPWDEDDVTQGAFDTFASLYSICETLGVLDDEGMRAWASR